jgi:hypothetical protein
MEECPMQTRTRPFPDARDDGLARGLDALAHWVAERLELGELEAAWSATRALEALGAPTEAGEPRPPAPVIGRRFAAAHAAHLGQAPSPARVPVAA